VDLDRSPGPESPREERLLWVDHDLRNFVTLGPFGYRN